LFSGHFQGNDVGVGTPVLVELLVELLAEVSVELLVMSLAELLLVDVPLLVPEDTVELEAGLEDVSELDVVALMSDGTVDAESVAELELEVVVSMSDEDELVLRLEVVVIESGCDIDAEPVLELELDVSAKVDELVLTDIVRVLTEDVLPVAELELDELDELLAGPAEYTTAPAG
jgi:hypothetical protein